MAMAPTFSMAMVSRLLPSNGVSRIFSFESLYCYSTVVDASPPRPHFFLEYLSSSLGFSKEEAIITTKKLHGIRYFRRDPNLVVNFLSNLGLSKTQIKSMVYVEPRVLSYNVEKTLAPKIRVLHDIGISGSDLVRVLMSYKSILVKKKPSVDYLRNLIGNDEQVAKLIKKHTKVIDPKAPERIASTVELLQKKGFSWKNIIDLLMNYPACIFRSPEFLQGIMDRVENDLGISRQSKMFYRGFRVLCSISDSKMGMKFEIFRSFGWSDATIYEMLRRSPNILLRSEDKIRKSWNFFVKELGYPPDYLAARPVIVNLNFETRVKPRSEVLKILKEKKLKRTLNLHTALTLTESKFVNRYVLPYKDEIPDVYDSYFKSGGREKAEIL